MRFFLILVLAIVSFSCDFKPDNTASSGEKSDGTNLREWSQLTASDGSHPMARHEAAFVKVGGKFYLLGGRGIKPVNIFNTETKKWSSGAETPIELHHFQPVVFNDKIYVTGALTGPWPNETPATRIYIYDPAQDAWSEGPLIPVERRRGSTGNVVIDGKIYLACGIKNGHIGDHKNWLDRFDIETGEWTVLTNAPRSRDHFQAVEQKGKVYLLAGRNTGKAESQFGSTIGEIDVYDIETDSWSVLPTLLPTLRAGNAATLFNDEILVIGGESDTQEKAHSEVEALNLENLSWRKLPHLKEGRHGTGVIVFQGQLYIASGCGNRGGEPELSTMESY